MMHWNKSMENTQLEPLAYWLPPRSPEAGPSPSAGLSLLPGQAPSQAAWEELAARVAGQPNLTPFSAESLALRWQRGYSAILLEGDAIRAHASCLPVYHEPARQKLAEALQVDQSCLPAIDVYEFLTGWTDPRLRRHGVSLGLRRLLIERFIDKPGIPGLAVGVTVGLGASPVLARLGWQMAPWTRFAYLSSLLEASSLDCQEGRMAGWCIRGVKPYEGEPVSPFENGDGTGSSNAWEGFTHLWVSDLRLARLVHSRLRDLMPDDLCRWRSLWQEVIRTVLLAEGWLPIVFDDCV
jgi:hypothetical protein